MSAGDERPRIIADVSSYEQMLAALRARINELQINGERFDEYAGLPRGYLSKLVGAKPIRRLGMTSFQPVLAALGLRCLFIEDKEATQRLKNRLPPRNQSYVRADATHVVLTFRFMQKIGRKGAQARGTIRPKRSARNGRGVLQSHAGRKLTHELARRRRAIGLCLLTRFGLAPFTAMPFSLSGFVGTIPTPPETP